MPVAIFSSFSTRAGAECQEGNADPTAQGTLDTSPLHFLSTDQGFPLAADVPGIS